MRSLTFKCDFPHKMFSDIQVVLGANFLYLSGILYMLVLQEFLLLYLVVYLSVYQLDHEIFNQIISIIINSIISSIV